MSTTNVVIPSPKRTFFRFWLPWLILALAGLGAAVLWFWPSDDLERANRVAGITWMIAPLTALLLGLWVAFLSGWTWRARLATVILVPLAIGIPSWAMIKEVRFTGNMFPLFTFCWERTADEILEAHRKGASSDASWTPGYLSGNLPADFPEYRGRRRDGVVQGPPLARDWQSQPPRLVWRQPSGGGYSAFAVAGNAAVTLEQRRNEEAVVCYDRATGKEVWSYSYPAWFKERLGGPGPRATPTIADGEVFSLGALGMLVCLDQKTGARRWRGERYDHGQLLLAGDLLVILGEQGDLALVEATPESFRELGRMAALEGKTWNTPALAGGKVFLRNDQEMACYDLTGL